MSNERNESTTPKPVQVEVVYALPQQQVRLALELTAGSSLGDALTRIHQQDEFRDLPWSELAVGIYGEVISDMNHLLEPGDRIEIYRPLEMTPMQARRRLAESQS